MARLSVRTPSEAEQIVSLTQTTATVGRSRRADIPVNDTRMSREHFQLVKTAGGYEVKDLGSANGTRVNGRKVAGSAALMTGDLIEAGRSQILYVADSADDKADDAVDAGQTICFDALGDDTGLEPAVDDSQPQYVLQYSKNGHKCFLPLTGEALTIGRHPSCGLVLPDKSVSSCHAKIDREHDTYVVHDLGSTNGIKVNGRVVESAPLQPGTRLRIGNIAVGFKQVVKRPAESQPPSAAPSDDTPPALPPV